MLLCGKLPCPRASSESCQYVNNSCVWVVLPCRWTSIQTESRHYSLYRLLDFQEFVTTIPWEVSANFVAAFFNLRFLWILHLFELGEIYNWNPFCYELNFHYSSLSPAHLEQGRYPRTSFSSFQPHTNDHLWGSCNKKWFWPVGPGPRIEGKKTSQENVEDAEAEVSYSTDSSSLYPDLKDYHHSKPDRCTASKKNHVEQNFFIASSYEKGRSIWAMLLSSFFLQFQHNKNAFTFDRWRRGPNSGYGM